MKRITIKELYETPDAFSGKTITVCGWCRNLRTSSSSFGFLGINDGSCFKNLQVVLEAEKLDNYKEIASQNIGAALIVKLRVSSSSHPMQCSPLSLTPQRLPLRALPHPITPFRTSVTPLSSFVPSLIFVLAQTRSTQFSVFAPRRRMLFINSSTKEASFTFTHLLSPHPTVRAQARCSA